MPLEQVRISPASQPPFCPGVVRLDYASSRDGRGDWAMLWPQERAGDWLIFIHGHGSTGDQLFTRTDIRQVFLPSFREAGLSIASLNLRGNAWMSPAAVHDTGEILAYLRQAYGAGRFIFASGSMAGTSNLIYAARRPEDVAGVVALCPATDLAGYHGWCRARGGPDVLREIADAIESHYGGPPAARPEDFQAHSALRNASRLSMPVFVSHGSDDAIIPVTESRALAQTLGQGADFFYEELPGGHHDSPLASMPRGLKWVLGRISDF